MVSTTENEADIESCEVKVQSLIELTSDKIYGMLVYNLKNNTNYYLRPYAVFKNSENNNVVVYGETISHLSN